VPFRRLCLLGDCALCAVWALGPFGLLGTDHGPFGLLGLSGSLLGLLGTCSLGLLSNWTLGHLGRIM
jgi:hypothetical protein